MMFLLPALPQRLFSVLSRSFSEGLVFHLPRVGSTGMQWPQKLISDWCLRVLIWTSWCSHVMNVNKAHAFVGSFESSSVETNLLPRPRCDLYKQPLKYSEDLLRATHKLFWKFPSVLGLVANTIGHIRELLATAHVHENCWIHYESLHYASPLWADLEDMVKLSDLASISDLPSDPYLLKEIEFNKGSTIKEKMLLKLSY